MSAFPRYAVYAAFITLFSSSVSAESWVEFHSEKWNYKSQKVKKKLNFRNRFYYDADSLKKSIKGDADVWVKEVSMTDRYYVGKGVPESEEILKQMHFWCGTKKYEVISPDVDGEGMNEALGEEVKPGSLYEKLLDSVCSSKKEM